MDFAQAVAFVLDKEKGLVDDPQDPGGLTNWGIALNRHPELTAAQVRAMTPAQAATIYQGPQYWGAIKGDQLPEVLMLPMLDTAVLEGPTAAIHFLQRATRVVIDGVLGPSTLAAANAASPTPLLAAFTAARLFDLASKPGWAHDGMGWAERAAEATIEALQ
jgi:lysozyme family protein